MKNLLLLVFFAVVTNVSSQSILNLGADIKLNDGAILYSDGSIQNTTNSIIAGDGELHFTEIDNDGSLMPGTTVGELSMNSDLNHSSVSIIQIDIQGNAGEGIAGGNDLMTINGDIDLNGVLNVSLLDSFVPNTSDEFVIINYSGTLNNTFTSVNLPAAMDGFEVDYATNGIIKLVYTGTLSNNPVDNTTNIKVYPNPASDFINIIAPNDIRLKHISLINIEGKLVYESDFLQSFDVSNMASGMYFLKVTDEKNNFSMFKVMIQ